MDLDVEGRRSDVLVEATPLILLDTNAVIWLHRGDRRVSALAQRATRLYASPATILELQFLIEAGRLRLAGQIRCGLWHRILTGRASADLDAVRIGKARSNEPARRMGSGPLAV